MRSVGGSLLAIRKRAVVQRSEKLRERKKKGKRKENACIEQHAAGVRQAGAAKTKKRRGLEAKKQAGQCESARARARAAGLLLET